MPTTAISLEVLDDEGHVTTEVLHFDSTDVDTVAKATAAATEWASLLNAVSGVKHGGEAFVTFPLGNVAGGATITAGYTNDRGAYLSLTDSDGRGVGHYVPGFLMSKIANGVVNAADTQVAALIAALQAGTGVTHRVSTRGSGALWNLFKKGVQKVRDLKR